MKVFAVMPAWREETRIAAAMERVLPWVDGLVVIDDGSEDGTFREMRRIAASLPQITCLQFVVNRGQGAALRAGTEMALRRGAELIVHVDADGQHDPAFIPQLVEPIRRGEVDVVFGSRFLGSAEGIPWFRRQVLVAAKWFNTMAMGIPRRLTDPSSGMRAMSSIAARQIDFRQDRMAHCTEILRLVTRSDLRWTEVPIRVTYSKEVMEKGQKNLGALKIVWDLFLGMIAK